MSTSSSHGPPPIVEEAARVQASRPVAHASPSSHPVAPPSRLLRAAWPPATSILDTSGLELTCSARGALFLICQKLAAQGRSEILLPAFHCPSAVMPALAAGLRPVFYRIRRDLRIDIEDLVSKVSSETSAALVIHFFGHEADSRAFEALRERGVPLIEDWSHSFLLDASCLTGRHENYRVYSFWKLVPSILGGGFLCPGNEPFIPPGQRPGLPHREHLRFARKLIGQALAPWIGFPALHGLLRGPGRNTLALTPQSPAVLGIDLLRQGERYYPFDPRLATARLPALARRIVQTEDLERMHEQRRRNYEIYARHLKWTPRLRPLFADTPKAAPWVFPVLLEGRQDLDFRWKAQGVQLHTFGIYLHSALFARGRSRAADDALFLAERMLCLAIHQDLSEDQIRASCDIINCWN